MNEKEKLNYIEKKLTAIYEDLDVNVNQQLLLRKFLKNLLEVIKGANPTYNLNEIHQQSNDLAS